jgi:chitinase
MDVPRIRARFAFGIRPLLAIAGVAAASAFAVPGSTAMPSGGAADPIASASANPAILAPPDVIVGEADGAVDLDVRLAEQGLSPVNVNYSTVNGTAVGSGSCTFDFKPKSGTLTFAVGDVSEHVSVEINNCADVEGFEAFTLVLSLAVNGTIARASSRISIVDNDTAVTTPRIVARDAVVDEKDGTALVSVLLGGTAGQASSSTVTVHYATSDGTAAAGSDFADVADTLSFAPGETAKTVAIPITDDGAVEGVESFSVDLSSPSGATIADGTGVVTIGASDAPASSQPSILAPADAVVGESDGYVDLGVHLSAPGQNPVSVHYTTANDTAVGSTACTFDYTPVSGDLIFAPGETTKVVRVQILDCLDAEALEAFTFELSAAVNGAITRSSGGISIVDNDTIVATPRLFVRDAIVDEKDGFASVSVLLGGAGGQASNSVVTVDYATADGTATAGADYNGTSGTLTFAPGETAKTVSLAIEDDATVEGVETFTLELSNPTNATIADDTGVVVIGRSDAIASAQPGISAPTDLVVGERDGSVDLMVSLAQPGQSTVTVDYATANSTAVGSTACTFDFAGSSGTLTFAAGETTKAVRVQILDCGDVEGFEAFTFGLASPVNGTIARASGRISIVDNDTVVATPKLAVRDAVVDEKDGFALVPVLLGGPGGEASNSTVTVDYTTASGSATSGADYTTSAGTLRFAPGETAKTVVVAIADDGASEPVESFVVNLSNATQSTIADSSGTILIGASDAAPIAVPGIFPPSDVLVGEGTGYVDLVVNLSVPGQSPVSVHYATANDTAVGSTACTFDYTPVSGALNFAPGETTKVIRVQVLDCPDVEDPESFNFTISAPVNGSISAATGKVTICDNDSPGPVTLCGIAVTPSNPTRDLGEQVQFAATGTYSDLSTVDLTSQVTWASAITSVATMTTGGLAHAVGGGTSTISATLGAISGSTLLTVRPVAQTITFGPLGNKTYGDPNFAVGATSSSGLPVSFSALGNCTVAGQIVHLTGAGNCTITASQAGNASYLPAPNVSQSFAIAKAAQTINFGPLANKTWGDPDFLVGATASSGLPVGFAASGNCTIAGQAVHITGAGSCTITASQVGNVNYLAAPTVGQTFAIGKAAQTIAFAALPNRNQGDPDFNVGATATSGLPVGFATGGSCTVGGSRVHLTGPGTCTITASQPGNSDWNAAAPVARSFSIAATPSPPPPPVGPPSPPPPPTVPREPAATPAPGPRDTEIVYDPKRKTFLINVQYLLRNRSCRNPCPARAELRTRNGRRLYAAGKLPGDGRVVLGARRGIKLPQGRKVFFYIPIKVAQLQKVHFKTVRGYRYGETRLRVWLRTPKGEMLTVRDGRIRVSIARVKSGALPNLRGIL